MRCQELMKRDVACAKELEPVQAAACQMRVENIGFLPVCDDAGRVRGVLTDRDIVLRVCAENRSVLATRVGDVMTREVVACLPTDEIRLAEELMGAHHKSRVLVVDEEGHLVGVISLSDIALREGASRAAQTMRQVAAREARPAK